ncbi:MAG TPA: hypothetical protein VD966_05810 [Pyrinomonadaceae bacterium]|nr:hypothetical protein [Pyrinomonadaceae bacterium]
MYKPNFCAECGARIARARWNLWTSRRFCTGCARQLLKAQILFPLISGVVLFGIGLIAGRAARPAPPPLIVERGQLSPLPAATARKAGAQAVETTPLQVMSGVEPSYGPDGTATERPTDQNETVSVCGARTKKGTPCQRRVRGTGRCWQHKGLPAIIRNTIIN